MIPVFIDNRMHLKIKRGLFCRTCHAELSRRAFVRLVNAFIFTFPGLLVFPFGLSMLVSAARRWVDLMPIRQPPEPLGKLVVQYRESLRGYWSRIHSLAVWGEPVQAVVSHIHGISELPPRVIYAALRCLESASSVLAVY
jgi:hypothetical protein